MPQTALLDELLELTTCVCDVIGAYGCNSEKLNWIAQKFKTSAVLCIAN